MQTNKPEYDIIKPRWSYSLHTRKLKKSQLHGERLKPVKLLKSTEADNEFQTLITLYAKK